MKLPFASNASSGGPRSRRADTVDLAAWAKPTIEFRGGVEHRAAMANAALAIGVHEFTTAALGRPLVAYTEQAVSERGRL